MRTIQAFCLARSLYSCLVSCCSGTPRPGAAISTGHQRLVRDWRHGRGIDAHHGRNVSSGVGSVTWTRFQRFFSPARCTSPSAPGRLGEQFTFARRYTLRRNTLSLTTGGTIDRSQQRAINAMSAHHLHKSARQPHARALATVSRPHRRLRTLAWAPNNGCTQHGPATLRATIRHPGA